MTESPQMRLRTKRHHRTVRPVVCRLLDKTSDVRLSHFSYFVAVGSFTADGGLLQPMGRCKDNTSQDQFRSVNTRNSRTGQKLNKSDTVTTIELVTRSAERKAQQCVK